MSNQDTMTKFFALLEAYENVMLAWTAKEGCIEILPARDALRDFVASLASTAPMIDYKAMYETAERLRAENYETIKRIQAARDGLPAAPVVQSNSRRVGDGLKDGQITDTAYETYGIVADDHAVLGFARFLLALQKRSETADHYVPPITDPLGVNWRQPQLTDIFMDDTKAYMGQDDLNKLYRYDASYPSGTYPGKMWARRNGDVTYLVWYGQVDGKNIAVHSRIIEVIPF